MANEMRTYVTVVSEEPKVAEKLKQLFTPQQGQYEVHALDIMNRILGTEYSYSNETTKEDWDREVDFPDNKTWENVIGPKWMYVDYYHSDKPENCEITIRSAWSVPFAFLQILTATLTDIDESCYIKGTYEDEGYDPCGAFVYGKGYDDAEDYDEEFDWDEYEEDDFYLENFHDELFKLQQELELGYFEYLQDKVD